jgi:hypothetical protein
VSVFTRAAGQSIALSGIYLLQGATHEKAFSGTTLTDPDVVRRQEATFENPVRQGFTLESAVRGLLIHNFTIGFCVEEQAVAQVTASGDDSYSPARRAAPGWSGRRPPTRDRSRTGDLRRPGHPFTELVGLLLGTIAGLVARTPR